jgi:hypothetical protein
VHGGVQLRVAQRALPPSLVPRHDGRVAVAAPEQILREVEPRPGEPPRPEDGVRGRHPVAPHQHRVPPRAVGAHVGHHAAPLPEQRPEPRGLGHRPVVEPRVPEHRSGRAALVREAAERGDRRALDRLGGRRPDRRGRRLRDSGQAARRRTRAPSSPGSAPDRCCRGRSRGRTRAAAG